MGINIINLQGYWARELIIYVYNKLKAQVEDWKASEDGKHYQESKC